jgi:hypothetical protein
MSNSAVAAEVIVESTLLPKFVKGQPLHLRNPTKKDIEIAIQSIYIYSNKMFSQWILEVTGRNIDLDSCRKHAAKKILESSDVFVVEGDFWSTPISNVRKITARLSK